MRPSRPSLFVLLLLLATTAHADVARLLDDDGDAAQSRVDLIQQARVGIDAVYFLARNDEVTMTALGLLREARRRGLTTRLVVDSVFNHIPKPVLAVLADEGVEVRVYHPISLLHPFRSFHRMHEKIVIVDRSRYITGGRNLAANYFGMTKRNFVDRDIYVDGPSAMEVDRHFETLWASDDVASLNVRVSADEKADAGRMLDRTMAALRLGGRFVEIDTGGAWSQGQPDVGTVRFLHDPVNAGAGTRVGDQLFPLLEGARHSIVIESPYVIPSMPLLELLVKKQKEGVPVHIVTNSLHSMDGLLPYVAYLKYRRRLVRAGIELHEFRGPDTLHAKSFVIDGATLLIGSFNLDRRSQDFNAEAMCLATNAGLARALTRSIEHHVEHATRVTAHSRARHSLKIWAMRLLLPFIEGQL